jgi:hypothetical protein
MPPGVPPATQRCILAGKAVKRQREAAAAACSSIPTITSQELGEEAAFMLQMSLAALPPGVAPSGAPAWAAQLFLTLNGMQAQLTGMQAQFENSDARIHNGLVGAKGLLRPLRLGVPPAAPPGFPATRHDVETLTGPAVNALLQFYMPGVGIGGHLEDRRNTLKQYIGIRPL